MATKTSTMVTELSPEPHLSGPLSDGNSSSLSELDDIPDEQPDFDAPSEPDVESVKDNDTEAETERIDPSPTKARRPPPEQPDDVDQKQENGENGDNDDAIDQQDSSIIAPEVEPLSPVDPNPEAAVDEAGVEAPEPGDNAEPVPGKTGSESPRKRKRSSSLSDLDDNTPHGDQPARKRSASHRHGLSRASANAESEPQRNGGADDGSGLSDEDANMSNAEEATEAPAPLRKSKRNHAQDDAVASPTAEEAEAVLNEEGEDDDGAAQGDQDEADNAARNEEEHAKKLVAMDNFKGIESKWAIFRDKLFDEKLKELAAVQEDLEQDEPTNITYLRQRQCLDERRDEKIRVEDRLCFYKTQSLERKTVAERAIWHSHFNQHVRELRDDHLMGLNAEFSRVQRERRQTKTKEQQFIHTFEPNRPQQITNQRSYNKEVSLLSGIAKYHGFPGAPELEGAAADDVEADLKQMKIKPQATSYSQIANLKHFDEMAGEANFLAKNTWARNPPPLQYSKGQPAGSPAMQEGLSTPRRIASDAVVDATGSASMAGMASEVPARNADGSSKPANGSPLPEDSRAKEPSNDTGASKNGAGVSIPSVDEARNPVKAWQAPTSDSPISAKAGAGTSAGNGASSISHTPRVTYFGSSSRDGEKQANSTELKSAREGVGAAEAFPLSRIQERPQFGPLASGIVADQPSSG